MAIPATMFWPASDGVGVWQLQQMNLGIANLKPCSGITQVWPAHVLLQTQYASVERQRLPGIANNHAGVVNCSNESIGQSSLLCLGYTMRRPDRS